MISIAPVRKQVTVSASQERAFAIQKVCGCLKKGR
jgi:hypothetical protein